MPPASTSRRALPGVLLAGLLLSTGCQTLGEAGPIVSRSDLVNDLAARLGQSGQLTYAADYRLAGGQSASVTQAPPRTAYAYPGGMLVVAADAITECVTTRRPAICTIDASPGGETPVPVARYDPATRQGLVTAPVVISLLTAAALDTDTVIAQRDTTIAGRHATCVSVSRLGNAPASAFEVCVTAEGVLGSFSGVVSGIGTELALSRYQVTVDQAAFEPPAGAEVTDRRSTDR